LSDKRPPDLSSGATTAGPERVAELDQTLWSRLANATTAEEYCTSWLALQSRMIEGVSLGLVVLERSGDSSLVPVAAWPRGSAEPKELTEVLERAIRERKGIAVRKEAGAGPSGPEEIHFHLAYPVWDEKKVRGAAALQIAPRPQSGLKLAMRQLQWGISWLQNWALRHAGAPEPGSAEQVLAALELTALALQEERFQPAAMALATELATRLQCDRVSIGFVQRRQVKVRALSHSAQFGKQMNLIRAIGEAMGECVDQEETLVYPRPEDKGTQVLHAHQQLARTHGDQAICSVPFQGQSGKAYGAMTLERAAGEPFDRQAVALADSVAALAGPILEEKRKNDRLLITKIGASLWSQVQRLVGPRHAVRKLVAIGILALVLVFSFATAPYRVTAETVLEGEIQRVVAAPFRGFIAEAPLRGGDLVEEGQVICTLDDRDLRVEFSRVSSQREQYVLEQRRAMADGDAATMNVLGKKMQQAEAQLELLADQIERTRIVAPFDGWIVSGDLSQALGAPVEEGQVLFEVAPLAAYRVMLKVEENEISQVEVGQTGELILTALPKTRLPFRVTKVTPVSVSEEGKNLFMVEARLEEVSQRLRPGMEGFGKIEIDRRKLIWIWTHKMINWVRLRIWSWLP
jgi:multidrug resistance efflux pump